MEFTAIKYRLGDPDDRATPDIFIEYAGGGFWAVTNGGAFFNREDKWELDHSRDMKTASDFARRCHYSIEQAMEQARKALKAAQGVTLVGGE